MHKGTIENVLVGGVTFVAALAIYDRFYGKKGGVVGEVVLAGIIIVAIIAIYNKLWQR